jgi:hypothetical protein
MNMQDFGLKAASVAVQGFNFWHYAPQFHFPLDCGLRPCPTYESRLRLLNVEQGCPTHTG